MQILCCEIVHYCNYSTNISTKINIYTIYLFNIGDLTTAVRKNIMQEIHFSVSFTHFMMVSGTFSNVIVEILPVTLITKNFLP